MPTASKSGTRKATRQTWHGCDRARSRLGPRSRPRPDPFAELASAMQGLIRFHQTHPDWFPPAVPRIAPPSISPEWEAAIRKAYHLAPDVSLMEDANLPPLSSRVPNQNGP
jgi:hypothetical protein